MHITIDGHSGFCSGVINAIQTAEEWLRKEGTLYCLGDIVHNSEELQRLVQMGLKVISYDEFRSLRGGRVLIRAHGEPPETYRIAQENGIEIIDATCKVVLNLQQTIKREFETAGANTQILIFGKQGHAEVIGLLGQTDGKGLVISSLEDIQRIDLSRPACLFSQTTQNSETYQKIIEAITAAYTRQGRPELFTHHDTICHSVTNRARQIEEFARQYDRIIFVSGAKSSNGLYLYEICKKSNPNTHFITALEMIPDIPAGADERIGICGATSTPMWLMEKAADLIQHNHPKIHYQQHH